MQYVGYIKEQTPPKHAFDCPQYTNKLHKVNMWANIVYDEADSYIFMGAVCSRRILYKGSLNRELIAC